MYHEVLASASQVQKRFGAHALVTLGLASDADPSPGETRYASRVSIVRVAHLLGCLDDRRLPVVHTACVFFLGLMFLTHSSGQAHKWLEQYSIGKCIGPRFCSLPANRQTPWRVHL
jgi:hypothetical protein